MQTNTSKKILMVLINLAGIYKGGAQRRYLALFNYLQHNNHNEFNLLLNDSLYDACFRDGILTKKNNVMRVPINYGKKANSSNDSNILTSKLNTQISSKPFFLIHQFLGQISSFIKHFYGWIGYAYHLFKIIRVNNIKVIYGIFTGGVWSWPIAKILGIDMIYSYNDASASMVENNFLKLFNTEYYALKYSNKIDFLSEGIIYKLGEKKIKVKEDRIFISPNSFILYENFLPSDNKKNKLVFSARLTHYKNPHLVLEAVSILKKRNFQNFDVHFLGEGILLQNLIAQKTLQNLDNVFFEGSVIDTALFLRESKIFISIQSDNNYPSQALLEAMACENAIIASDVGETRKLVNENEGVLVSLDALSIAEAIQFLISNPDECERLGKNARKKALVNHNIEKYANYFFEITNTDS